MGKTGMRIGVLVLAGILSLFAINMASEPVESGAAESEGAVREATVYTGFPFEEAEAKRRQQETAEALGVPVELTVDLPNGVKMEFMLIPAGEFMMGSPENEQDRDRDESLHRVRITKPFYMAKYECTQEQWQAITGDNPSWFKDNQRNPVEEVSWNDINNTFLPAIQKHAPKGMTFRLPTEAQWEYACRAGTSTPFHFGATITTDQVNYDGNYPYGNAPEGEFREKTTPVGTFPANAWGLHDMHGNVWEWCQDWYANDFYSKSPTDDPENTKSGTFRVLRGGNWYLNAEPCRSAFRLGGDPHGGGSNHGFRLVLELP